MPKNSFRIFSHVFVLFIALFLGLFAQEQITRAAAITWTGAGTSQTCPLPLATNEWACAANWSNNAVPGPSDVPSFNSSAVTSVVINTARTTVIGGFSLNSGYTGVVSVIGTPELLVNSNINLDSGAFDVGTTPLKVTGYLKNFGVSTFVASSTTTKVGGDFHYQSTAQFDNHNGTFIFENGNKSLFTDGVILNFYNLNVNLALSTTSFNVIGATGAADGRITVLNNLSLIKGGVYGNIEARSGLSVDPNFGGGSGVVIVNGAGIQNITIPNLAHMCGITLDNKNAVISSPPGSEVYYDGPLNINKGTFRLSNFKTHLRWNLTYNPTSVPNILLDHNNGKVIFDGTAPVSILAQGFPLQFYDLDIAFSGPNANAIGVIIQNATLLGWNGEISVTHQLNLINGNLDANINALGSNSFGGASVSSTFDGGGGQVRLVGTGPQYMAIPNGAKMPGLKIDNSFATVTIDTGVRAEFGGPFEINSGEFVASDFETVFKGPMDWIFNAPSPSASFDHNNGKVIFSSGHACIRTQGSPMAFYDLDINFPNNTFQFYVSTGVGCGNGVGHIDVLHDFTFTSGVTYADITVEGNVNILSGVTGGNGKITFSGTNNQSFTSNATSLPTGNFEINKPSGTVNLLSNVVFTGTNQSFLITSGALNMGASALAVPNQILVSGDLIQGAGNLIAKNILVGSNGSWTNNSSGDIVVGDTSINTDVSVLPGGAITINGGGSGCGQNSISIRPPSGVLVGAKWSVPVNTVFTDVDIQAINSAMALIAMDSNDSGSNTNIQFVPCADTTPPTVISINPPNNQTNVSVITPVTILWDEDVVLNGASYANNSFVYLRAGTTFVPATAVYSNANSSYSYIITPTAPLASNTLYTLTLGNTIEDLAGNDFLGQTSSFTTGTAPTVTSITPANNATNVAVNTTVTINWSEDVVLSGASYVNNGAIYLKDSGNAFVPATGVYNNTNSVYRYVITPTTALTPGVLYTLTLANTIVDISGDTFAGQTSTFTTVSGTVNTNPYSGKLLVNSFTTNPNTITFKWVDTGVGIAGYNFYATPMTTNPTSPFAPNTKVNNTPILPANVIFSGGVATYTLTGLTNAPNTYFFTKTQIIGTTEGGQTPIAFKVGDVTIDVGNSNLSPSSFALMNGLGQQYPDYLVTYTDPWRLKAYIDTGMGNQYPVFSPAGGDIIQGNQNGDPINIGTYILPAQPDGLYGYFDAWALKYNLDSNGNPTLPGL